MTEFDWNADITYNYNWTYKYVDIIKCITVFKTKPIYFLFFVLFFTSTAL